MCCRNITDIDTTPNRLQTRLVTTITVTIPPQHIAVIPVPPSSLSLHSTNITTELVEMKKNSLLYIEQPYLCVIDTLHRLYDRHQSKYIMLAVNVSDEEFRINKGITICFTHVADVTEIQN